MVSQKHCSEPKNGFRGENGGWCIGDALISAIAVTSSELPPGFTTSLATTSFC